MQKGYFAAAWDDIKNSPGWFSRMLRMGLLLLIPVFGIIVVYGYLYAWARDIAWNVHRPMPEKIFGNEDGKLYSRGFFIVVVVFVFSLIPSLFSCIPSFFSGLGTAGVYDATSSFAAAATAAAGLSLLLSLVTLVLYLAVIFFMWVGSMRVALYGTLSSGFQLGKIWSMIRYDFAGLLRIFGMNLLLGAILCVAVIFAILFGSLGVAAVVGTGIWGGYADDTTFIAVIAVVAVVLLLVFGLAGLFFEVFTLAMTSRALGYWTRQFEVSRWGGQDDPLPFESRAANGQSPQL